MSILDAWEDLLRQAEALEVDGDGLEISFANRQELHYALVAMVIFNSKTDSQTRDWGYSLDTQDNTLYIYKVSLEEK